VRTDSDRDPGAYYLLDVAHHKAKLLTRRYAGIDPKQQLPAEPFTMKARDGLDLHGFVTRPAGGGGPAPMIVIIHGSPEAEKGRDDWYFDSDVQLLAQRGYAVLRVNFRGSGGYGLAFRDRDMMQWGAAMQDDIADATHWAVAQGIADPKRICTFGYNYGAYAALMGVVKDADLYKCAAGFGGPYDLARLRNWTSGIPYRNYQSQHYFQRIFGNDDKQLADRSPVKHAAEIKVPVLLAHGHYDMFVDVKQSEAMRDAIRSSGGSVEFYDYPGEDNHLMDPADRMDFYSHLLNFFDVNIGAGTEGAASAQAVSNQQLATH
jgi:dipeptidyl aminopeptidase/acylaminoacyl peptidase